MSQNQEVAKVDGEGEKKEPEDLCKTPGYCSSACLTRECVHQQNKNPFPKTSDVYAVCNLPKRFEHPHWYNGYGSQTNKEHPFYRTSASEYGWYPPGITSIPSVFFPLNQNFTEAMYATGMYRNYSLNMSAPDPPTKMC